MTRRYTPPNDAFRIPVDFTGGLSLSTAVVFAVSSVNGEDPRCAPALQDVIDPDSLDRLFAGTVDTHDAGHLQVSFTYNGYEVTIDGGGWLSIVSA